MKTQELAATSAGLALASYVLSAKPIQRSVPLAGLGAVFCSIGAFYKAAEALDSANHPTAAKVVRWGTNLAIACKALAVGLSVVASVATINKIVNMFPDSPLPNWAR